MTGFVPCSSSSSRNSVLSYALSPSMRSGGFTRRIRRSATGQSCASPPVNRMAMRRPLASASAWIFVLRPPRERPTACFCSPPFPRLPSDALSHEWNRSSAYRRICRSQPACGICSPRCHAVPSEQTDYRSSLEGHIRVDNRTSGNHFEYMHDAADNPPIVHSINPSHIRRQMKLDLLPLLIAQPKQILAHDPDPFHRRIRIVLSGPEN